MAALVEVNNLVKTFKDLTAVNNLSFTVNEGDVYGFLGQNGAGKSTTIRMLLTLIAPTSGGISLFGHQLPQHRREILQQVGAIIERPDLYKYLSAYDNLRIFARMSGLKPTRQQLMDQLAHVHLAERATSKVKTFSQGMKQRLGIAIALVHDPKLIILDEPTNGLDPQGIADMRQLIINLRKDHNKTVIVSSHLLNEIEQIATRILIINKGKKIIEGDAGELLDPSKVRVTLQTNTPDVPALLTQTMFEHSFLAMENTKWVFEMDRKHIPLFNEALVQRGVQVQALAPKYSLEDYFLSATASGESEVSKYGLKK